MISNCINKIGFICLCLTTLVLVGCFHIPSEDRLPNKNKVITWNAEKDEELEQTLNSFMNSINLISSQLNEDKDSETNGNDQLEDNNLTESEDNNISYEGTIEEEIDNIY